MNKLRFYTMFCTIIFLSSYLIAQENVSNTEEQNDPMVSIHAEDTHLPTILSILAKQSDYNIVTGPNVENQNNLLNFLHINIDEMIHDVYLHHSKMQLDYLLLQE